MWGLGEEGKQRALAGSVVVVVAGVPHAAVCLATARAQPSCRLTVSRWPTHSQE
jgi:hypothetical protein